MRRLMLMIVVALAITPWIGLAQPQAINESPMQAFVLQSSATAQVRRAGWTEFTHLSLGAGLQAGDLLDPKDDPIVVICADLSKQIVTSISPVPCPKDRTIITQNQMALAGWQRGSVPDPTIPYLISPRKTLVTSATPLILWNPVDQADSYQVTVLGEGLEWSTLLESADSHSLIYPQDAPPLQADVPYTVEIVALEQGAPLSSSADEDAPDTSFHIIAAEKLTQIQPLLDKVHTQITSKSIANLIDAQVYIQNGLYADALEVLLNTQASADTSSDFLASPIPQLILGNIYAGTGVQLEAEGAYDNALTLAQNGSDLESKALALTGLARLTSDSDQRGKFAAQAVEAWDELGATAQADATASEFNAPQTGG
ncbi:MAG: hypothetical protein ABI700_18775 [Chloroflexota bacterium]